MSVRLVSAALVAALSSLALAACGGGSSGSTAKPAPKVRGLQEGCEAFFARARECREPYIDALVGVRIELDKPAGIAAEAEAQGKASLVARAQEEFENDSKPEAVTALCTKVVADVPPDQVEAMSAEGERCLAAADCDAFAACSVELNRARISAAP